MAVCIINKQLYQKSSLRQTDCETSDKYITPLSMFFFFSFVTKHSYLDNAMQKTVEYYALKMKMNLEASSYVLVLVDKPMKTMLISRLSALLARNV